MTHSRTPRRSPWPLLLVALLAAISAAPPCTAAAPAGTTAATDFTLANLAWLTNASSISDPEQMLSYCAQFDDLYGAIHHDLRLWRDVGIPKAAVDKSIATFSMSGKNKGVALAFSGGRAYVIEPISSSILNGANHHAQLILVYLMVMLGLERRFGKHIPDVEFVLATSDRPMVMLPPELAKGLDEGSEGAPPPLPGWEDTFAQWREEVAARSSAAAEKKAKAEARERRGGGGGDGGKGRRRVQQAQRWDDDGLGGVDVGGMQAAGQEAGQSRGAARTWPRDWGEGVSGEQQSGARGIDGALPFGHGDSTAAPAATAATAANATGRRATRPQGAVRRLRGSSSGRNGAAGSDATAAGAAPDAAWGGNATHRRVYTPVLRFCGSPHHADIRVPYAHFSTHRYDDQLRAIPELNEKYPWPRKIPTLFGRFSHYSRYVHPLANATLRSGAAGRKICSQDSEETLICSVRQHMMHFARQTSAMHAASAAKRAGGAASGGEASGSEGSGGGKGGSGAAPGSFAALMDINSSPRLPMPEHAKYKYLLHLDGQACSSRLEQLLPLGSLVFKEDSGYWAFYHHLLQPHKHYMPFWKKGPEEILPALSWAKSHDAIAASVPPAAQAFALKYLNGLTRACYWHRLLLEYSKLLRYKPASGTSRPAFVPVSDFLSELRAKVAAGGKAKWWPKSMEEM